MRTPNGQEAGFMDRIMLLSIWANDLAKAGADSMIFAGMGKPTYPINDYLIKATICYWSNLLSFCEQARNLLNSTKDQEIESEEEIDEKITHSNCVSNYGHPQGEFVNRIKMAEALRKWYPAVEFQPENILFNVGGAGALYNIFEVLNSLYPNCRIITPFPHYSLYKGPEGKNHLFSINLLDAPGYRLTANLLDKAIKDAKRLGAIDGGRPAAFLLCDPNNPLGTVISRAEVEKIAEVLRKHPELYIILDEAYAEMCLNDKPHPSLLRIAPDLAERTILMRSATKALSAAGERCAITATLNEKFMGMLLQKNIEICGHAPKSLQFGFAEAMLNLDKLELNNLVKYYYPKVKFIYENLVKLGANMPDKDYKVDGTFYVVGDFSDLMGMKLPDISSAALNKTGVIETDEDIAYYLLVKYKIMIAPLSYFGINSKFGYLRITCSGSIKELNDLVKRLATCLVEARKNRQNQLMESNLTAIDQIKQYKQEKSSEYSQRFSNIDFTNNYNNAATKALLLKQQNLALEKLLKEISLYLKGYHGSQHHTELAALKIQSAFRGYMARKKARYYRQEREIWNQFIKENFKLKSCRHKFFSIAAAKRKNEIPEWPDYLNSKLLSS